MIAILTIGFGTAVISGTLVIQTLEKTGVSGKTLRRRKRDRLKRNENAHKEEVRERDVVCRFPLCPCRLFQLFLEVSHKDHKGMGGDPTGERSLPALMLLICNWRHKESKISIDRKGLKWEGLTPAGSNGPIAWRIDLGKFSNGMFPLDTWVELARERERGVLEPIAEPAQKILESLAGEIKKRFR